MVTVTIPIASLDIDTPAEPSNQDTLPPDKSQDGPLALEPTLPAFYAGRQA
jgi:hypothetical protein